MQKVFKSCYELDRRCYGEYGLNEDILMENAAGGMAQYIQNNFDKNSTVLIVSGVGNNGADGIVLARQLQNLYDVKLFLPFGVKSQMAKIQLSRAELLSINIVSELSQADVIVDAIFGAGLNKELDEVTQQIIHKLNSLSGFKIACDIPTGVGKNGLLVPIAFHANLTLTMGAFKEALFVDECKDTLGEIMRVNLGVSSEKYETDSKSFVLEKSDLRLPSRRSSNTHKGDFGHVGIFCGDKEGAAIIAGTAASRFGAGLCTLIVQEKVLTPAFLMHSTIVPLNCTALAIGMGLGDHFDSEFLQKNVIESHLPVLLDADSFYCENLLSILKQKDREIVITPHPKEFASLWKIVTGESLTVEYIQQNRFEVVRKFNECFPHVTLLLKGSNTLIMQEDKLFINPLGSSKLSKGGSGDVLSGLIVSLLAQGYCAIDAAIQGSLALVLATNNYAGASYSMLATDIINELTLLER